MFWLTAKNNEYGFKEFYINVLFTHANALLFNVHNPPFDGFLRAGFSWASYGWPCASFRLL